MNIKKKEIKELYNLGYRREEAFASLYRKHKPQNVSKFSDDFSNKAFSIYERHLLKKKR